jgi:hypothetical protein
MNAKIILKDGKELIGVSGIIISDIGDTIYINNSSIITDGIKGSLAFYDQDNTATLYSTGSKCIWNDDEELLQVSHILANTFESSTILSKSVTSLNISSTSIDVDCLKVSNFQSSQKLSVGRWLGFNSLIETDTQPFKLALSINPKTKKEVLVFSTNDYDNGNKPTLLLGLEHDRVYFNGKINIKHKTIETSTGSAGDVAGDMAVDLNFVYYCTQDFDGTSKIWKRTNLMEW